MPRSFSVTMASHVSAEPGTLAGGPNDGTPMIIVSVETDGIQEVALPLDDARRLVVEIVAALSQHGDEVADRIFREYFERTEAED